MQMIPENHLTGIGHNVTVSTIQEGNVVVGTYKLGFPGQGVTRDIPVTATEEELEGILEVAICSFLAVVVVTLCMRMRVFAPLIQEDLKPFGLLTAHVTRTDPTRQCENGLCWNGPNQAWGYTYFLTLSTYENVEAPTSPTRPQNPRFDQPGPVIPLTVSGVNVTCTVDQVTSSVFLSDNIPQTPAPRIPYHPYNMSSPVTLPYGGAGGSNGGSGGFGHARQPPFPPVLDDVVSDIVAGSNGAAGGEIPQQTMSLQWDIGAGGCGGGALELIAVNDLVIGPHATISVDGMDGEAANRAGGGGSGGTVLMSAGGVIVIQGRVSAKGGRGGNGVGLSGRGGGGGGGGRIASYSQSVNIVGQGELDLSGGNGGLDAPTVASASPTPSPGDPNRRYYPFKSFHNGVVRTEVNTHGKQGVLHMISAGGARYRIDLAVRFVAMAVSIVCKCFHERVVLCLSDLLREAPKTRSAVCD
jgi:hypothetical protein